MLNTTATKTFWEIISLIGIEVPAIQRDYAQGRNSGRIPQVRRNFIKSLVRALQEREPLRLDFVFGRIYGIKNQEEIRKNQKAIQNLLSSIKSYADSVDLVLGDTPLSVKGNETGETVYLIPLDGQQRLTALFLLHWYIFKRCQQFDNLQVLKRFRYKTRKSTELFIEMLCDLRLQISFEGVISDEIKNLELFSSSWLLDPTVQSMLVVLDEIDLLFRHSSELVDFHEMQSGLLKDNLIYFDFLNLGDFSLSDELYVKMNARGRSLTDFENFKAWLFRKIEDEKLLGDQGWTKYEGRFDIQWNDIFWQYKSEDIFEVDNAYLNFFKIVYLIDLVKTCPIEKSAFRKGEKQSIIESITSDQQDFDFEDVFDNDELAQDERFVSKLPTYFRTLNTCSDIVSKGNYAEGILACFSYFFNFQKWDSWLDLLNNYSVFSFIHYNSDNMFNTEFYQQYLRVLKNLINNQRFDNGGRYKGLLLSVDRINQHLKDTGENILEWLVGLNLEKTDFNSEGDKIERNALVFTKEQLEEEIIKAQLILNDDDSDLSWRSLIEEAERHEYFNGKISFLLTLSQCNKDVFLDYYNKIGALFKASTLNCGEYLMQRALLTFGNYFLNKGGDKVTFCKDDKNTFRDRSENWLAVLLDGERLRLIQNLVDDALYDYKDVNGSLQKIIDRYLENNPIDRLVATPLVDLDYYKLYIHEWRLFTYGASRLIQLDNNSKYAFQLNATNTRGKFTDNIGRFIKQKYFSENESVGVVDAKGWNNSSNFVFGPNRYLKLDRSNHKILFYEDGNLVNNFNTIEEVNTFVSLWLKNNSSTGIDR